ncbi:MAG: hypothetical protein HN509_04825 [Halobacteriovoraceae bacterium]|jgi:hypothetical protein|nr:hypothetical protein [Halobacteriovoraceae bacterium]MBT5095960.1 hypothetical protein [Halobacteriovoraceae bacterium]
MKNITLGIILLIFNGCASKNVDRGNKSKASVKIPIVEKVVKKARDPMPKNIKTQANAVEPKNTVATSEEPISFNRYQNIGTLGSLFDYYDHDVSFKGFNGIVEVEGGDIPTDPPNSDKPWDGKVEHPGCEVYYYREIKIVECGNKAVVSFGSHSITYNPQYKKETEFEFSTILKVQSIETYLFKYRNICSYGFLFIQKADGQWVVRQYNQPAEEVECERYGGPSKTPRFTLN